jgi:hypothetical protein
MLTRAGFSELNDVRPYAENQLVRCAGIVLNGTRSYGYSNNIRKNGQCPVLFVAMFALLLLLIVVVCCCFRQPSSSPQSFVS